MSSNSSSTSANRLSTVMTQMGQKPPLPVALIGAGRIGLIHAANIAANPRTRLAYVLDVNHSAAEAVAAKYGAVATKSLETILQDSSVRLVAICSATSTHADLIEASAKAGKAIFCEKPIDLSLTRVKQCLATVDACRLAPSSTTSGSTTSSSKIPLMIGFNRRFDPSVAHLQQSLRAGEIGAVELVTVCSRDPSPPSAAYASISGGLFKDMTIHDLDVARWLLNEEPVTVYASAAALVDPNLHKLCGDVDTAAIILTCASGRIAIITNSRRATYGYDQRIEVHGSGGMLSTNNQPETLLVKSHGGGVIAQRPQHFFLQRYAEAYRNVLATFIAALDDSNSSSSSSIPPYPTGHDGLQSLVLAEAATQSLKTGKPVALASVM